MKKKILGLLFAGIMMTGLTACKDAEEPKYAVIENSTSKEDTLCVDSVWDGVLQFANEHGETAAIYTVDSDKRKDFALAIETAVENGAEVVVCVGDELEVPVYEAQNDYTRVKFVLLNGTPHKRFSEKANISDNTIALQFDSVTDSYLAGYMAVASGACDIGCMSGAKNDESQLVASGFIQGAEAAAVDLGLSEGTVKIRYGFTGEDKLSPAYMGKALTWYTEGCEVIFAPNEQVRTAVIQAAESAQRKVIGLGKSSMNESETMLTAAYINYGGAVYQQLGLIKNEMFTGGQSMVCGAQEQAVAVVTDGSGLEATAIAQYQEVYQKLSDDLLKVNKKVKMPKTTLVTIITDEEDIVDVALDESTADGVDGQAADGQTANGTDGTSEE